MNSIPMFKKIKSRCQFWIVRFNLTCVFWGRRRKPENLEWTHTFVQKHFSQESNQEPSLSISMNNNTLDFWSNFFFFFYLDLSWSFLRVLAVNRYLDCFFSYINATSVLIDSSLTRGKDSTASTFTKTQTLLALLSIISAIRYLLIYHFRIYFSCGFDFYQPE